MEKEKVTFEELLDSDWGVNRNLDEAGDIYIVKVEKDECDDEEEEPYGDCIATIPTCWDEFRPLSQSMTTEDVAKLFGLIMHSKDMYKLLKETDSEEAKALMKKIDETEYPENNFY